jgi:hypothetical protein
VFSQRPGTIGSIVPLSPLLERRSGDNHPTTTSLYCLI